MYTDPDAFADQYGFYLYPTRDVWNDAQRLRNTRSPRGPGNLANEREIINGLIEDAYVTPVDESDDPAPDRELVVTFEDAADGVSELRFEYEKRRVRPAGAHISAKYEEGFANPCLHPSPELAADDQYDWDDPQPIFRFEFF